MLVYVRLQIGGRYMPKSTELFVIAYKINVGYACESIVKTLGYKIRYAGEGYLTIEGKFFPASSIIESYSAVNKPWFDNQIEMDLLKALRKYARVVKRFMSCKEKMAEAVLDLYGEYKNTIVGELRPLSQDTFAFSTDKVEEFKAYMLDTSPNKGELRATPFIVGVSYGVEHFAQLFNKTDIFVEVRKDYLACWDELVAAYDSIWKDEEGLRALCSAWELTTPKKASLDVSKLDIETMFYETSFRWNGKSKAWVYLGGRSVPHTCYGQAQLGILNM